MAAFRNGGSTPVSLYARPEQYTVFLQFWNITTEIATVAADRNRRRRRPSSGTVCGRPTIYTAFASPNPHLTFDVMTLALAGGRALKMTGMKITDQLVRYENAGDEIAGREIARPESNNGLSIDLDLALLLSSLLFPWFKDHQIWYLYITFLLNIISSVANLQQSVFVRKSATSCPAFLTHDAAAPSLELKSYKHRKKQKRFSWKPCER